MRARLTTLLLASLVSLAPAQDDEVAYWPDYRGPGHDGQGGDAPLPIAWSEEQGVVWKTPIEGRAWSSPVVVDGLVWLTNADEEGRELSVLCVALDSGELVHEERLFEVEQPQFRHAFNSYASPSPCVDGGRVYLSFGSPGTACVDRATKEVLWTRTDLVCDHFRGAGSSPIVVDDLLILTMDGADVQYVIALDKLTGETRWRTERSTDFADLDESGEPAGGGDYRKGYATPIVIEVEGRKQLISPGAKAAFAYEPATGEELWTVRYGEHSSASRTLFGHGLVYINTGYSQPSLLAVDPSGAGDVTATHVRWRLARGVPKKPSPVLVGEHLYLVSDSGIASCVRARTGEQVWQARIEGAYSASLIHAGGHVYAFSEGGRAVVLAPGEELELVGENELDAGCMASPAPVGDGLVVRTRTHLYRIR